MAAEHTDNDLGCWKSTGGSDNVTLRYKNQDNGDLWIPHLIKTSRLSSYLGARVNDLDNEGDYDVVSTGLMQNAHVHLWEDLSVP